MKKLNIISGNFKGYVISTINSKFLKPTIKEIRIELFDWINNYTNNYLKNFDCLDLFAGSGILSFEIFSRGCNKIVLVEKNKKLYKKLIYYKNKFNSNKINVLNIDAIFLLKILKKHYLIKNKFNIIFLDPPYSFKFLYEIIILSIPFLKKNGILYIECNFLLYKNIFFFSKSIPLKLVKSNKHNNIFYFIFIKK